MLDRMDISSVRHFHKNQDLCFQFISVINEYVESIQSCNNLNIEKRLKGGLDIALRIITGSHASFISKSFFEYLNIEGIKDNPFNFIWEDRLRFGKILINNRKLGIAVWEHTIPIKEFRENLINSSSEIEISEKIKEYPGVAWITRQEDIMLSKLGYRQNRPGGFLQCYECAGIELLNEDMYSKK